MSAACVGLTTSCASTTRAQREPRDIANRRDIRLISDIETYADFGDHRSGSVGERATANWLRAGLSEQGFDVEGQTFSVPDFDRRNGNLKTPNGNEFAIEPQAPFKFYRGHGELVYWSAAGPHAPIADRIVVFDAPYHRHSTLTHKMFGELLSACRDYSARALLIITNGPSGDAIWLNAPVDLSSPPIALIAPLRAKPIRELAINGAQVHLSLPGPGAERNCSNIIGRRRGPGQAIVISTPFSGWGICAGERGPGVAIFRSLSEAALGILPQDADVWFVATSGHELENLGAHKFLNEIAPRPENTKFWMHLGAGLAARDWHEAGQFELLPLPSSDPQRYLGATRPALAIANSAFKDILGLEQVYPVSAGDAAGELKEIVEAGYRMVIGGFGAHRFHHSFNDSKACIARGTIAPVYLAFEKALQSLA